ncbi:MAG TPA: MFS transporter [Candidatus Aquicultor sp.]
MDRYRWFALIFLAAGLAIVITDNAVLNVAVPYVLRDLNTTLDAMQRVISGYALIIATLLITMGRLGDMIGRRKVFRTGIVLLR